MKNSAIGTMFLIMAVTMLLVLACGKAHEQSMCFGEVEFPWDDRVAMRAAVADRMGEVVPAPPLLPTANSN